MNLALLILAFPIVRGESIRVRDAATDPIVDANALAVDAVDAVRVIADSAGYMLAGEDLLAGRPPIDLVLDGRRLDQVLQSLAMATRTQVRIEARTITFTPPPDSTDLNELLIEAEAAWISLIREFPASEAARIARVHLGRAQEIRGHEDAALAHYEVAASGASESRSSLDALKASAELLMRRGEWSAALPRYSRLAQGSDDATEQVQARLGVARCLSESGRGLEALALVEAVDLSFPPKAKADVAERALARARGYVATDRPADALRELDLRASLDPRLGSTPDDLALRARALQSLGAPSEAARAWLACSTVTRGRDQDESLLAAARLSASAGDDLAVLFIERLALGGSREVDVRRLADASRVRLGLARETNDIEVLQSRWAERGNLVHEDRVSLAVALVRATARERGVEAAADFVRGILTELPSAEARTVRAALAVAYEDEGAWAEAARVWGGIAP